MSILNPKPVYCACCGEEIVQSHPCAIGDSWFLTGFLGRFSGVWCRYCFHSISQSPNHNIIHDHDRYNKAVAQYEIRRANKRETRQ